MSEQPIAVSEAQAAAQAAEFLASQNLAGQVDLAAEGEQTSIVVPG